MSLHFNEEQLICTFLILLSLSLTHVELTSRGVQSVIKVSHGMLGEIPTLGTIPDLLIDTSGSDEVQHLNFIRLYR